MPDELRDCLLRQLETAWALTSYHLDGLTTEECLWRPAAKGLHVRQAANGVWRAEWPEHEGYDLGPPSIAWLTWHIGFWWSTALDYSFGDATLTREDVLWSGTADGVRQRLADLHERWRTAVERLSGDDLRSHERTRWPVQDRPFADVAAWVNVELMKNAAEIGYARFLYGVREG
ncbi:MAG TPA: DinB family protein [Pirellulaceae bacterium]|jgi:hypothetical protein|nr:DinB family protein [Pirellulaceae bacterium]